MTAWLNELLRQPGAQALGWSLLHFLWQGMLIAVAVRAVLGTLPRASVRARYAVACLGLLTMAAAPVATAARLYGPAAEAAVRAEQAAAAPVTPELSGPVGSLDAVDAPSTGSVSAPQAAPVATGLIGRIEAMLRPYVGWVVAFWVVGVLLLSLRLLGGWVQLQRLKTVGANAVSPEWEATLRRVAAAVGVSRPVRLLASVRVEVPSVIGALKPVVLLPVSVLSGLPPHDVELILAHELAHVRRHDYLVNLFQAVVETVLFYHPGVWWLSGVIREEREHCCDDVVVASTQQGRRYARVLLDAEELRWSTPPLGAPAASGGSLYRRARRLVAPGEGPGGHGPAGALTFLSLVFMAGAVALPKQADAVPHVPAAAESPAPSSTPASGLVLPAQGELAGRWRQANATARERGWRQWWVAYAVRPRAGAAVTATNGPADGEGATTRSAVDLAGDHGGNVLSLGGAPGPRDAVFYFRFTAGGEAPVEIKVRSASQAAELNGLPVAWLGVAADGESLALLDRLRASAPDAVRREIGPAASLHGDSRAAVAFIRALLADESSPEVRAEAAYWLHHQPTAESLALLEATARRDPAPKVREEAVTGIARMNTPASRAVLTRLANDPSDRAVRREAEDWLDRTGTPQVEVRP